MKKCVDGKMIEMTAEEIKEREAQIVADTAMLKAITDAQTQKETDKANAITALCFIPPDNSCGNRSIIVESNPTILNKLSIFSVF